MEKGYGTERHLGLVTDVISRPFKGNTVETRTKSSQPVHVKPEKLWRKGRDWSQEPGLVFYKSGIPGALSCLMGKTLSAAMEPEDKSKSRAVTVCGKPGAIIPTSLPTWSQRTGLTPHCTELWQICMAGCQPGCLLEADHRGTFLLLGVYRNSRLPEGKQAESTNQLLKYFRLQNRCLLLQEPSWTLSLQMPE